MNSLKIVLALSLFVSVVFYNVKVYSQLDNMQFPNRVCAIV